MSQAPKMKTWNDFLTMLIHDATQTCGPECEDDAKKMVEARKVKRAKTREAELKKEQGLEAIPIQGSTTGQVLYELPEEALQRSMEGMKGKGKKKKTKAANDLLGYLRECVKNDV